MGRTCPRSTSRAPYFQKIAICAHLKNVRCQEPAQTLQRSLSAHCRSRAIPQRMADLRTLRQSQTQRPILAKGLFGILPPSQHITRFFAVPPPQPPEFCSDQGPARKRHHASCRINGRYCSDIFEAASRGSKTNMSRNPLMDIGLFKNIAALRSVQPISAQGASKAFSCQTAQGLSNVQHQGMARACLYVASKESVTG